MSNCLSGTINKLQKLEDALIEQMLTAADLADRGDRVDQGDCGDRVTGVIRVTRVTGGDRPGSIN